MDKQEKEKSRQTEVGGKMGANWLSQALSGQCAELPDLKGRVESYC